MCHVGMALETNGSPWRCGLRERLGKTPGGPVVDVSYRDERRHAGGRSSPGRPGGPGEHRRLLEIGGVIGPE
jgi:hypothetical protein